MASLKSFLVFVMVIAAAALIPGPVNAGVLTPDHYKGVCPLALPIIRSVVKRAIRREHRMGASLLRLHFHDCFVNGCDGSILLDDTANFTGEKTAIPNANSVRGFEVVDEIKTDLNKACRGNVVSCADILAIAARDSVEILGGRWFRYAVLLGRKDARTANRNNANTNLPPPFFNFSQLLSNFESHNLDLKDLVVLSGGHTIGLSRCINFRNRIYNDTNINSGFAASLRQICLASGGNENTAPMDATPERFDTLYFKAFIGSKGLLHSDQELFKGDGSQSDQLVRLYSSNPSAFAKDFGNSMIKMGNLKPLTGNDGEIRLNCRRVNRNEK